MDNLFRSRERSLFLEYDSFEKEEVGYLLCRSEGTHNYEIAIDDHGCMAMCHRCGDYLFGQDICKNLGHQIKRSTATAHWYRCQCCNFTCSAEVACKQFEICTFRFVTALNENLWEVNHPTLGIFTFDSKTLPEHRKDLLCWYCDEDYCERFGHSVVFYEDAENCVNCGLAFPN